MKLKIECECGNNKIITVNVQKMKYYDIEKPTIFIEDFASEFNYKLQPEEYCLKCSKCGKEIILT